MLKQANCVKTMAGAVSDTLEAHSGESFLLKRIHAYPHTDDTYLTLKVDRKTVGVYRVRGRGGNQLCSPNYYGGFSNIMQYLTDGGINVMIPIAEGQILTFLRGGTAGNFTLIYDMYDGGDIRADMPNGTGSNEFVFMQYMTTSETINADGDYLLDTSLSPAEFPDFPCGAVVPSKCTIDIVALAGSPVRNIGGTPLETNYTTFLKLIKDRETLFDEDGYGIPFLGDKDGSHGLWYRSRHTLIGASGNVGSDDIGSVMGKPLIMTPPLHFVSGEELLMYVTMVSDTDHSVPDLLDIAAVLHVKKE